MSIAARWFRDAETDTACETPKPRQICRMVEASQAVAKTDQRVEERRQGEPDPNRFVDFEMYVDPAQTLGPDGPRAPLDRYVPLAGLVLARPPIFIARGYEQRAGDHGRSWSNNGDRLAVGQRPSRL